MDKEKKYILYILQDLANADNIDKFERCSMIKRYIEITKTSQRSLATSLNVPYSTLHDWTIWDKEKYDKLISDGLSEKEAYKKLRNTEFNKDGTNLVIWLRKVNKKMLALSIYPPKESEAIDLISDIKSSIRLIENKINK